MRRISTKELYLIGVIGTPYYIFAVVMASKLTDIYSFGFLIILPIWYLYDRLSQTSYIGNVKNGTCSKLKYALISVVYQLIGISLITFFIGAIET